MKNLIVFLLFIPSIVFSQNVPNIQNISPISAETGSVVTISGRNLSGRIFFGTVEASNVSGSGNTVFATVPSGATEGPITILTGTNLVAQSSQRFIPSFSGSDIGNFDDLYLVNTTETDAYDICMCDLDNDGDNDLAIAHNVNTSDNTRNEITIYRNNLNNDVSALAAPDFEVTQIINNDDNNTGFISTTCGDLNADGFPEIIFSANSGTSTNSIYIYRNVGNFSFRTDRADAGLNIPAQANGDNRIPRRVKIADIDNDGNNDVVAGNNTDGTIHVFRGNGDLTFDEVDEVLVENASRTGSIELSDFNNDGRVDIVSVPFRRTSNEPIYILKNNSQKDNVAFEIQDGVTSSVEWVNTTTADFDGDGLIDVAATNIQFDRVSVARNTTSESEITFSTPLNVNITNASPWGITTGDINGDGKPDLIVASSNNNNALYVIENTSTTGNISFATPTTLSVQESGSSLSRNSLNVQVGDLNGDAKPDIAFTDNTRSDLGIFINRNCVTPKLSPSGSSVSFCDSPEVFTLTTTNSPGATYSWAVEAGNNTNANGNNFTTTTNSADFVLAEGTASATISVTISSEDGFCTGNLDRQTYTVASSASSTPTISVSQSGTICAGDDVTLSTSGTFNNYFWTLPDGSELTTPTVSLNAISIQNAGVYKLRVQNNGDCSSAEASTTLEINEVPQFSILNNGADNFCSNSSVTLSVPDFSSEFSYQWKLDGTEISNETNNSLVANSDGSYTVEVTDSENCAIETDSYSINAVTVPTSSFTGSTETCLGFETTFTSTSSGDAGFTLEYSWEIRSADNSLVFSSTDQNISYDFPDATGEYDVSLTTSYTSSQVASCNATETETITVSSAPTISFDIQDGIEKCPADAQEINLTSPDISTIASYSWRVLNPTTLEEISGLGSTEASFSASSPSGLSSIIVEVEITTNIGCTVSEQVTVENFESSLSITTDLPTTTTTIDDVEFPSVTLEDASFIRLSGEGVGDPNSYSWEPASKFEDPTAATSIFFPSQPSEVVTLTAIDTEGCRSSFRLVVLLDNIRPRKTFSPNGDGQNDCWEILNIGDLGQSSGCEAFIFDSRGRNIDVVKEFNNDNCVWDGTFNGSQVPEGVYYYVLKCETTSFSKTGSILLAR